MFECGWLAIIRFRNWYTCDVYLHHSWDEVQQQRLSLGCWNSKRRTLFYPLSSISHFCIPHLFLNESFSNQIEPAVPTCFVDCCQREMKNFLSSNLTNLVWVVLVWMLIIFGHSQTFKYLIQSYIDCWPFFSIEVQITQEKMHKE